MKAPVFKTQGLAWLLACGSAVSHLSPAQAATFVVDFNNVYSADVKGSAQNSTFSFELGAGALVTGFSWDVNVTAFSPSWLSELRLEFTNSWGVGVAYSPAGNTHAGGTASDAGRVGLVNAGISFTLRPDGLLHLEFYDTYDDFVGAPDGRWNVGHLAFEYTPAVPEPASGALLAAGLLGLLRTGATTLRRRPPAR